MTQLSTIPGDITPARRLHEHVELVRRISLSRDPHEVLKAVTEKIGFVMAADARLSFNRNGLDDGAVRLTRSTRWVEDINPWTQPERLPVFSRGLLCDLMSAGRPLKIDHIEVAPDDPAHEHINGMRSLIATPLYEDGEPSYMVALFRSQPAAFTLDELTSFVLTGNLVGRVTGNLVMSQKLERAYAAIDREFRMVGQIQRGLLPARAPDIPGVEIATEYETSTRAGGDYYDFYPLCNGKWGAILADVSGHGPGAAVVMAMLRTLLRTAAEDVELAASPAKLLGYLNTRLMHSVHAGQFATAFALVIDSAERTVVYANAGHNPPRWLQDQGRRVVALDGEHGFPLAIDESLGVVDHTIRPGVGDRILLYTDGITEASNADGKMFGTDGLDATLHCCSQTPQGLIDAIRRSVHKHCGSAEADDDRTLVAIAFSE